ncbi:endolytic transglycosylase MltG [Nocardiopsis synnemataformans]|uniref:endolytic transglycosylase MltG n=1 Tax=Nocardiopsis synnemataformans TaxID=61305 RepID=UPI003EB9D4C4
MMNDRDDYPDTPYRGRADRERGYDYDPLSDPPPAQPPPRGRRARPEPADWNEDSGTGEFRTPRYGPRSGGYDPLSPEGQPPGRRHRAEPPAEGPSGPARRGGAADALRGGRAARSSAPRRQDQEAPRPPEPAPPRSQGPARSRQTGPAGDPTQDALAALANLGESAAPARPEQSAPAAPAAEEEPTRRGRRARPEHEPESPPEPQPEEPRRGGGRRRRGAPADEAPAAAAPPPEEEPRGRRARRRRGRRDDEPTGGFLDDAPEDSGVFDSGTFPGVSGSADTGAFAAVEEPPARRSRRARADRDPWDERSDAPADSGAFPGTDAFAPAPEPDSGAFEAQDFDEEPQEEPEPRSRRSRRRQAEEDRGGRRRGGRRRRGAPVEEAPQEDEAPEEESAESFAEEAPEEEPEPRPRRSRRASAADDGGRRGGRRRRGRREEPEEEPEEEDEYEEPNLADIAEAYGGGRSSRRKAKELKRARANAGKGGRKRRRRSRALTIVLALILLLVVAGGGYAVIRTYVLPADFDGQGSGETVFVIEEGDAGSAVADNLAEAGVVASSRAFLNALGAVPEEELGSGLAPGTYSLAQGMSGEAAVAALLDPASRVGGRVTIPEGLRTDGIFERISEATDLSVEELDAAYAQTDELGLPDYATEGPEGYLFPSTYRFDPGTEALSVIRTMVTQHTQVAEEIELENRAEAQGYDANEIMAIAAIVQAETGTKEDMPLISAVVHNRLAEGMQLQMDSTCFYVLGEEGTFLNDEQRASCEADPRGYSTYGMTGLPVGPFVAPGVDAIEAALEPADEEYLYFALVDPENGETGFSNTLEEHNQMVAENQAEW